MKILLLNTYETLGGASIAAYRLFSAIKSINSDTYYYYFRNNFNPSEDRVKNFIKTDKIKLASSVIDNFHDLFGIRTPQKFSSAWFSFFDIVKTIDEIKPDIVHLHWINDGFIPLRKLKKIKVPIVWSMHDNWVFTGGCHVKWSCERFLVSCGKCPILHSESDFDLSRINYIRKKRILNKINNIKFVGLSKWLLNEAKRSSLLRNKEVINLPNTIDTSFYDNKSKIELIKKFKLNPTQKLICFGAMHSSSDLNKGYKYLRKALFLLVGYANFDIIIFGSDSEKIEYNLKNKIHRLGFIDSEEKMIEVYNLADVVVVPSIQENLSNTIMESMSCGTPVVSFNIGGNSDMIDHKINGYLAEPYSPKDLAEGIKWVLNHPNYEELSQNARKKIERDFDSKIIAMKYMELYQKILNDQKNEKSKI